ncbi:hypothetical protein QJS10_CPB19g00881 [Acorus calamus]|uniref:Uncharacterized protein n=1 Tax=Acorus calamus TaxID=4465 RepID=A0AAV9CIG8_ACOCL|nr:hypothetical protein QJS10_CPB19g00881 [Acorus calamus]
MSLHNKGAATLFWSSRGLTGYWEVKLRRAVRAEEVDQYLELLEILRQQELSPDRPDVVIWRSAVSKGFSVKSGYSWLRRDRSPLMQSEPSDDGTFRCNVHRWIGGWWLYSPRGAIGRGASHDGRSEPHDRVETVDH